MNQPASRNLRLSLIIASLWLVGLAQGMGQQPRMDYVGDPLPDGAILRLGTSRLRHPGAIEFLQFTGDGKLLIAVGYRTMPSVWDVETGARIKTDAIQFEIVDKSTGKSRFARINPALWTCAAFGREGNTLLSVDFHDNVIAWDLQSGKETKNEQMGLGDLLFTGRKSFPKSAVFQYVDPLTGRQLEAPIRVLSPWKGWSLAADGKHLSLPYWSAEELRQGKASQKWAQAAGGVVDLRAALTTSDKKFAAISDWQNVSLQNLENKEFLWTKEVVPPYAGGVAMKTVRVNCLTLSPDGKMVAAATDNGLIELLDVATGERVAGSRSHPGFFSGPVQFVPKLLDGKLALLTLGKERVLWDLSAGKKVRSFGMDTGEDTHILSPDGESILVGDYSDQCRVRLEETVSGKILWTLDDRFEYFPQTQFSADGQTIALDSWRKRVVIFVSAKTGQRIRTFQPPEQTTSTRFIASPEMTVATESSSGGRIQLWEPASDKGAAQELWSWTMPADCHGQLRAVHFVPGGKWVLAEMTGHISIKESLFMLDAKTGKQLSAVRGWGLYDNISPDGRFMAYTAYKPLVDGKREIQAEVRDLQSGEVLLKLENNHRGQFSADGKIFASAEGAGTVGGNTPSLIEFYDLETKQRLGLPRPHTAPIRYMNFAPSGNTLAVHYNDSTVILWDARAGAR